jgi:hypothetical protein
MKHKIFLLIVSVLFVHCLDMNNDGGQTIKIACLGNSITAGSNVSRSYPDRLKELLGSNYSVYNYGRPGWPVPRPELAVELDTIGAGGFFDTTWNIVISKFGTNDGRYYSDLTEYYWEGKEKFNLYLSWWADTLATLPGNPEIYYCIPVPAFGDTRYNIIPDLVNDSIVPAIREFLQERRLNIIDCYSPFIDSVQYFPDGIHPNDSGTQKLAEIIFDALTNRLKP